MAQLKGLVFDMDGTLVDNLAYHFAAFEEYAKREGFELLEPVTLKHNGMHLKDIFPILFGEKVVEEHTLEKLTVGKESMYREMYRPHIAPIAGLIELLHAAKELGVKCAIGSSGCRENVEMILEGLNIADLMDVTISGSDVTHGKPHPEIFATAIERMGLKPEECVVVEDAVNGILAGVAAGSKCIGITTTATAEELKAAGANMCISDYTMVTINDLQNL